jgi:alpha-tubulin suppressor-like RCC1 family protein
VSANNYNYTLGGITSNGGLYLWGWGQDGEIGNNTVSNYSSPVKIGTSSWNFVSVGLGYSAGIRIDGALFIWGSGAGGQLGNSTISSVSSPIQVGTSSWSVVNTNNGSVLAITITGALFAWGNNPTGTLGDGTAINKSSPVQIGTSSWTMTTGSAGYFTYVSAGITTSGALYMWGSNGYGQLGNGTTVDVSSPVAVLTGATSSWSMVSAGYWSTAAITTAGALWAWGNNSDGTLGDGTTVDKFAPVQIGSSSWSMVALGGLTSSMAIRSDGTLWGWGNDDLNQLGDGLVVRQSSPVQAAVSPVILSYNSPVLIAAGGTHTVAVGLDANNNANLFAWGLNTSGQLGNGTTLTTQVPSSPAYVYKYASKLFAGANYTFKN